jgi:uncharacterized cupin superfamily protein
VTDYAVKNLKEVTDQAVKFGLSPDLEARFAREDLGSERTGLSYQRLAPGTRAPFSHKHGQDEEIYVVISGSGRVRLGDELVEVKPWDAIRVAPGMVRAFAAGPEGIEILAFGTHTADDAEQLPADWPDQKS